MSSTRAIVFNLNTDDFPEEAILLDGMQLLAEAQPHAESAEAQPALAFDCRELDLSLVRHCLASFFRILCSALPLAGYPASRCRISGSAAPDIRFWPAGCPAQRRSLPSLRRPRAGFALGLAGLRATSPWRISAKCLYAFPFTCEFTFIPFLVSRSVRIPFAMRSPDHRVGEGIVLELVDETGHVEKLGAHRAGVLEVQEVVFGIHLSLPYLTFAAGLRQ